MSTDGYWQSELVNDVLGYTSKQHVSLEIYRDGDEFRIVSKPPKYLVVHIEILDSPDLRGVSFDRESGVMTIEDNHGTSVEYRPVMTVNYMAGILLEKVEK